MSKKLSTIDRLFKIDMQLKGGSKVEFNRLVENVNSFLEDYEKVSKRTVENDIKILRDKYDAPIKVKSSRLAKERFYYYENASYRFMDLKLFPEAISQFKLLRSILNGYPTLLMWFPELESTIDRVLNDELSSDLLDSRIQFEFSENLKGIEHLPAVFNAIINRKKIYLKYSPYTESNFEGVFFPLGAKEFNKRWFLFCVQEQSLRPSTFAVDRIDSIDLLEGGVSEEILETSIGTKYNDIIGVTLDSSEMFEKILIRLQKPRAYYLQTKPIHKSQFLIDEKDSYMDFSLDLYPNKELYAVLLQFAGDISILEPDNVKEKFKAILQKALSMNV